MAKSPIDQILSPVNKFIHQEFTGGIILFINVIIAIVWVNSPSEESYHHWWDIQLSVGFHDFVFYRPLHVWINDGLMALFFFVIGLELKKEFIVGELSTVKKASLPMMVALGGVHATIAGMLVDFTIPARTKIDEKEYVKKIRSYTLDFENEIPQNGSLTTAEQHQTIEKIKKLSTEAETPLLKIEYSRHPRVAFVIMPLFALANAGMVIRSDFFSSLLNPVSIGVRPCRNGRTGEIQYFQASVFAGVSGIVFF